MGHRNGGLDDDLIVRPMCHVVDEDLVDLELVYGKVLQIGQRRVTRSEVIDRQQHSGAFQPLEQLVGLTGKLHQLAFGDFQFEPIGRQAAVCQQSLQVRLEIVRDQLCGGDVDGHYQ
ncbi:hypothetical protein D3C78_777790 [compost metagenome]